MRTLISIFLVASTFILISSLTLPHQKDKVLVIRVLEYNPEDFFNDSHFLLTTTVDGYEIEKFEYNFRKSPHTGNVTIVVKNELEKWFAQGYELVETHSVTFSPRVLEMNYLLTTFILQKKE